MTTSPRLVTLAITLLATTVAAFAADAKPDTRPAAAEPVTVKLTVSNRGYEPKTVEVPAGVPIRLEITRQTEDECVGTIQSEALAIPATVLSTEKPTIIELPAQKPGDYAFACPMAMVEGKLVVKPAGG
jgi:plastocyanin domain-containing protein